MVYGARATVIAPDGRIVREEFRAGAFRDYLEAYQTRLNLAHDASVTIATTGGGAGQLGALELFDSAEELRMVATLPPGEPFDQALRLVADGSTAETSVEFRAIDQRFEGDHRIIEAATLPGVALVDAGAYRGAVEVRKAAPVAPRRRRWWL